jgi:type IV secretion system protein VirB9
MRRLAVLLLLAAAPAAAAAQVAPTPSFDDPRLQTVAFDPARPVRLVAFPGANLTVMLLPGEQIERAVVSDESAFEVRVAGANDSLNLTPLRADATATLLVDTALRRYEFDLATGDGLAAAYLVRFVQPGAAAMAPSRTAPPPAAATGKYRLTGERSLLPSRIADDGERTFLEWDAHQSLPAVFGVGTNGEEEVVDGYMRGDVFTIDRVYGELVFRIDKMRARARRLGGGQG